MGTVPPVWLSNSTNKALERDASPPFGAVQEAVIVFCVEIGILENFLHARCLDQVHEPRKMWEQNSPPYRTIATCEYTGVHQGT